MEKKSPDNCVTVRIFPLLIINLVLAGNISIIRMAVNHWSDGLRRRVRFCVPLVLERRNCIKKIYRVHECRKCHVASRLLACISISERLSDKLEPRSHCFIFLKACVVSYSSLPRLALGTVQRSKETSAATELELWFWTPMDVFIIYSSLELIDDLEIF